MDWLALLFALSLIQLSENQIVGLSSSRNEVASIQNQERGLLSKPSAYVIGPNRTTLVVCQEHQRLTPTKHHRLHIKCKGLRHKVRFDFLATNDDQAITTRLIVTPHVIKKHRKHISCHCIDVATKEKSPGLDISMNLSPETSTGSSSTLFKPNRNRIRTVTLRDSIKFSWRFLNSSLVHCMHDGHSLTKDQVVYGEGKISVVIEKAFRKDAGFYYCRSVYKSGVFSRWLKLIVRGGWSKWKPWLTCGPGKKIQTRRCLETRRERCQGASVRALPCVGHSCEGIVRHFVDEPVDQVILNGTLANVSCAATFGSGVFTLEMFCSSNGWKISYFMTQNKTTASPNTNSTVVRLTYEVQLHRDRNDPALVLCHCYMLSNLWSKRSRNAKISFSSVGWAYNTSGSKPSFMPSVTSTTNTNRAVTVKASEEKIRAKKISPILLVIVSVGVAAFMLILLAVVAARRMITFPKTKALPSRENLAAQKHQKEPTCYKTETVRHFEPPETKIITLHDSVSSEEEDTLGSRASNSPLIKKDVDNLYEPLEESTPHPSVVMTEETDCEGVFQRGESWKSNKSAYSSVSAGFCPKPKLPDTVDPDLCAWGEFTAKGGRLTIEGTDVTLYIPSNALPAETTQIIYIGLMNSKGTYPKLKDQESLLSPVVVCGPDGLTFEKPVFLTVPHNAVLDENNCWHPRVQSSSTVDKDQERGNKWKVLERPGGDAPLSHVSDKHMQIMIDHFTNFAVVGEASSTQEASAQLKMWIIAYYTEPKIDEDLIIRIYCIPATAAAYKVLEGIESKLDGKMSDSQKLLQICNNQKHLQITSKMTHVGWKTVTEERKSISFDVIWQCTTDQSPNVSFIYECVASHVFKFRSIFDARQEDSDTGVEALVCFSIQANRRDSSGYESQANGCQIDAKYIIPIESRRELCHRLDPEDPMFNDWRNFAEKLGFGKVFINNLKGNDKIKSPTDVVIEMWEMTLSESKPLSHLEQILCDMERDDAVKVLQKIQGLENTRKELSC